jgi:SRSO17 transposase
MARRLIATAVAGGLPCRWVAADEAYGGDPQLAPRATRPWARLRPRGRPLAPGADRSRYRGADQTAAGLPRTAWQRLSAGTGAKGLRYYDWAFVSLPHAEDTHGGHHWMLVRRNPALASWRSTAAGALNPSHYST